MLLYVLLWFLLGAGASIFASFVFYNQLVIDPVRIAISVGGALTGALILLIAAPDTPGWALLTAPMGSSIALTVTRVLEQEWIEPW